LNQQLEDFWAGQFGTEYHQRNTGLVDTNVEFFKRALHFTRNVDSVIELGAGIGDNLAAIKRINPQVECAGLEINEAARKTLKTRVSIVFADSVLTFKPKNQWDLAFSKGLLIHIAPEDLPTAYDALYASSYRYILIAEYYSPKPREIEYRGNKGKLWARDFAGEFMDRHPDCQLIDVHFAYHRDPHPQDDITAFLFEKRA
jgi:pseudaminic acid biosynthesis-associated methylase